jgi:hypothetical protein
VSVKPLTLPDPTSAPPSSARPAPPAVATGRVRATPVSSPHATPSGAVPTAQPSSTTRFDPYEHM